MPRPSLRLYETFARLPRPRSYSGKLLLVAFVCVHVPLLVLTGVALQGVVSWAYAWPLLLVVLVATLAGTVLVMSALYHLLAPVRHATEALEAYRRAGTLPGLPTHHTDQAGRLLRATQHTLTQLDGLLRLRSRLLGVLSHDLRTPHATIRLATDLLIEELEANRANPGFIAEMAGTIHTSVRHADLLTSSLLESARQGDSLALKPETVTSYEVLARVAASVGFLARRKHVELHVEDNADAALLVDLSKLMQVLGNFVTNAIKFTPRGGHVTLTARAEADAFVFEVRDTGTGFDLPDPARLFEAFGETRAQGTDGEDGHGLGLWISQTFAERLGGTVGATSVPGVGSVFALRLPRVAVSAPVSLAA